MVLPSEKSFPRMAVQIQLQWGVQQRAIPHSKWPISTENRYAYNIDKILYSSVANFRSYFSWESEQQNEKTEIREMNMKFKGSIHLRKQFFSSINKKLFLFIPILSFISLLILYKSYIYDLLNSYNKENYQKIQNIN